MGGARAVNALAALWEGFQLALTPAHLGWGLLGVTLGTAVGVLPGIGPALTVALLLPATYGLEPTAAFIMFAGIYYGGMYGGSTTSILLNTPGESATIVTALDGHQMARRGRAGAALATAAIGSFVAGTLGTLAPHGERAGDGAAGAGVRSRRLLRAHRPGVRRHGDACSGASRIAGLLSLSVGVDARPRRHRPPERRRAAHLRRAVPARRPRPDHRRDRPLRRRRDADAGRRAAAASTVLPLERTRWMSRDDWARSWKPWLRGTAIGFPLGALPAGGAELPTLLSYAVEKRLSRHPRSSATAPSRAWPDPRPPTTPRPPARWCRCSRSGCRPRPRRRCCSPAFQQFGLQAGPLLFQNEPRFVWTLLASLYVGNVLLLVLNLPLIRLWVLLLRIPTPLLYGGILVVATVGAWSVHRSAGDIVALAAIGALGFALRRAELSAGPGDDRRDARPGRRHAPAARAGDRRGRLERRCSPGRCRPACWRRRCWCSPDRPWFGAVGRAEARPYASQGGSLERSGTATSG